MKKTIYALFLMLLCCVFFVFDVFRVDLASASDAESTKNAFQIVRQANSNGKIALSYIFPVNSAELSNLNFTEQQITTYKFYLATYVTALLQQYQSKKTEEMEVSACTYFADVDGLGFSLVFDNLNAQKQFFGTTEDEKEESSNRIKTSGFFMKKVEIFVNFPVSSTSAAESFKLICQMATTSWCNDQNIENVDEILQIYAQSVFIYDFASTESSLKSEVMMDDENFHHNIFQKTQSQIAAGEQIVFYTLSPNVPIWYLAALVVVVLAVVFANIFVSMKFRKNLPKKSDKA